MSGMRLHCLFFLVLLISVKTVFACTDIRITAKDGTVIITRSMEFALDMQSNITTSNRGRVFNTIAANNTPGLSWTAQYGYVFLNGLGVDMAVDGLNEKGLSFGALYLPGFAGYQEVPAGQEKFALPYYNLGDWILSNFETVAQVKDAIAKIFVYPAKLPNFGDTIFPLHASVYDASGKGLVIEYVNGRLYTYENAIGVLTNSPTYDWHLINLSNYLHLSPQNPNPVIANGITFAATGQGFGMIGLPGDISPASRFVKMATFLQVVMPAADAAAAVNLSEHLINNVDIPSGLAREATKGNYTNETTQWVVFKDLKNRILYYRTYQNLGLRSINLNKINFAPNAPRLNLAIASPPVILDMTDALLKTAPAPTTPTPVAPLPAVAPGTPTPGPKVAPPGTKTSMKNVQKSVR